MIWIWRELYLVGFDFGILGMVYGMWSALDLVFWVLGLWTYIDLLMFAIWSNLVTMWLGPWLPNLVRIYGWSKSLSYYLDFHFQIALIRGFTIWDLDIIISIVKQQLLIFFLCFWFETFGLILLRVMNPTILECSIPIHFYLWSVGFVRKPGKNMYLHTEVWWLVMNSHYLSSGQSMNSCRMRSFLVNICSSEIVWLLQFYLLSRFYHICVWQFVFNWFLLTVMRSIRLH